MPKGPVQLTAAVVNGRGFEDEANTMPATVTRPGRWHNIAAALVAGLLLAACSTSSPSSSPSPRTTPPSSSAAASASNPTSALCPAAANLRASVGTLTNVPLGKGTIKKIKSDLANLEEKLAALTAELHGEFKAQTSAVKTALHTLKIAISHLADQRNASTVTGVATAISGVAAAASNLLAALPPQCRSSSASPSP